MVLVATAPRHRDGGRRLLDGRARFLVVLRKQSERDAQDSQRGDDCQDFLPEAIDSLCSQSFAVWTSARRQRFPGVPLAVRLGRGN